MSNDKELAKQLVELWGELEEGMGEMAAYHVACEMLGIDPDDGWEMMALAEEKEEDPTPCCYQHGVGAIGTNEPCPKIADNE